jgi:hypothetical protein
MGMWLWKNFEIEVGLDRATRLFDPLALICLTSAPAGLI